MTDSYDPALETCADCGENVNQVWHTPDELWRRVTGQGDGICLCVTCFDNLARAAGILLQWGAALWTPSGQTRKAE